MYVINFYLNFESKLNHKTRIVKPKIYFNNKGSYDNNYNDLSKMLEQN
jgi:hypothetical protein